MIKKDLEASVKDLEATILIVKNIKKRFSSIKDTITRNPDVTYIDKANVDLQIRDLSKIEGLLQDCSDLVGVLQQSDTLENK